MTGTNCYSVDMTVYEDSSFSTCDHVWSDWFNFEHPEGPKPDKLLPHRLCEKCIGFEVLDGSQAIGVTHSGLIDPEERKKPTPIPGIPKPGTQPPPPPQPTPKTPRR